MEVREIVVVTHLTTEEANKLDRGRLKMGHTRSGFLRFSLEKTLREILTES